METIIGIIFASLGILGLVGWIFMGKKYIKTKAEILEVHAYYPPGYRDVEYMREIMYYPTLRFKTIEGNELTVTVKSMTNNKKRYKKGEIINVLYYKNNPNIVVTSTMTSLLMSIGLLTFGIILLTLGIVMH